MPEMDGIEKLVRLKQSENKCKSVPVIVLTANAIVGAKDEYIKAGFSDYISKPIEGAEMEHHDIVMNLYRLPFRKRKAFLRN